LNGELMQSSTTADLIFGIQVLLRYIARSISLEPGDVVATGTPSGVGWGRRPQRFLRHGDRVAVRVGDAGVLANPVRSLDKH
jgi:2,4-diketo-3-deoxy-L-fuconate hydrolase